MNNIVYSTKPDPQKIPGFWECGISPLSKPEINIKHIKGISKDDAFILQNVFTQDECQKLINFMHFSPNFEEVGVQGMKDTKDERIGSLRTSIWCNQLAEQIWNKIKKFLPYMSFNSYTATDWWQQFNSYEEQYSLFTGIPVAISPLLRFMKYENGGLHYAHYDAGYIYPNFKFRTLKSMVIYLTTNKNAATRFIKDQQEHIPIWLRDHLDWSTPVKNNEIIGHSHSIAGNVLIFNHRMCHDVEQYFGQNPRIIIRGDIVYNILIKE